MVTQPVPGLRILPLYGSNFDSGVAVATYLGRLGFGHLGVCIPVENETKIDNVYDEILKQELLGNVVIQRYHQLSFDDKDEIFKLTVRAIHMQRLLVPSEYIPKQEQARFVQTHFPQAWDTASQMNQSEVEQMINEWRASLKKDKETLI